MRRAGLLFLLCSALLWSAACRSSSSRISCRKTCGCRDHGMCAESGDRCVADDADDCRASAMCAIMGRCTLEGDRCVVGGDKDCASSKWCNSMQMCTAREEQGIKKCVK